MEPYTKVQNVEKLVMLQRFLLCKQIITTGEGGMVVTSNEDIAEGPKVTEISVLIIKEDFLTVKLVTTKRMTNIQAALGLAQLERIDELIETKRRNGSLYAKGLSKLKYKVTN